MTSHLVFFVEEQSMEAFLRAVLPKLLPGRVFWDIHAFQGKQDLLRKLPNRLRGLAGVLAPTSKIVVLVDRDDDDCRRLKKELESIADQAGLRAGSAQLSDREVINRIVVEELEAWYFGDWEAVREIFPKVSSNVPSKKQFRDPDAIAGGTWETLERILQRAGYYKTGIAKITLAQSVGSRFDPNRCTSRSFRCFRDALGKVVSGS